MKVKCLLLPVAILFGISPALAAGKSPIERRYTATFDHCMASGAAAQGLTYAVRECLAAETRVQDARLNQAYKMVMARLPANRREGLRLSERNWIKARDAGCEKQSTEDGLGGDMAIEIQDQCVLDETIKRTIYLEQYR